MKRKLILLLFYIASISTYALHISQEDIDGNGPHFIIDDIWACILLGIFALFVAGLIIWCIFATIWIGLERLFGLKRTTKYVNVRDAYLSHSLKKLKRFKRLSNRLKSGNISESEKKEYDVILQTNEVFRVPMGEEIHVICYYLNGICQVNQKGWCATLYTYNSFLGYYTESEYEIY